MPSGSDIKMKYYIIVFKNTLDAMSGEKAVKEMGLSFRMVPTSNFNNSKLWLMCKIR